MPETLSKAYIEVEKGESYADALKRNRIRDAIAVEVDGKLTDLSDVAETKVGAKPVTVDTREGLTILRHSAAHLLANAIMDIYKGALPNAGPPTEDGFYYDFDMEPVSTDDFGKIEERMREIVRENRPIEKLRLSKDELKELFSNNVYKLDKIDENLKEGGSSTAYRQGDYVDFCTGPHVPSTGYIKSYKLLSLSSAHYKADESRQKMVRIYGTAFPSEKQLNQYLRNREEAARRDHRRLAQEMDLLVLDPERAPGFPLYTPNGTVIRNELIGFMREMNTRRGWSEVSTPHAYKTSMWKQSGHYAKYKDDMYLFTLEDGESYGLKPMNCPGHVTIFERMPHSYREMPVKYSEAGTVYRYEKWGEVSGLTRPRSFTIDDGHAFLRIDQILEEMQSILGMVKETFDTILGESEILYDLSLIDREHPENYLLTYVCSKCGSTIEARKAASSGELKCSSCGSSSLNPDFTPWDQASGQLKEALDKSGIQYREFPGEAAFYGPKIDIHVKDALGRSWQLSTIQLDFFLPINFNLNYINSESKPERLVMIHRAIFGSYERFMAILLEHYAGKLPTWIAPMQVYVIPVSEGFNGYATKVHERLREMGIRSELDLSPDTISKKIKLIRSKRPAYIAVLGEREQEKGTVTIRNRSNRQNQYSLDDLVSKLGEEVRGRSIGQTL
ncbi:threonyl-tRNA synthetase [uncultured archaeon]|nr:threonyl-tRNA synthetase [uncultured archaeon]